MHEKPRGIGWVTLIGGVFGLGIGALAGRFVTLGDTPPEAVVILLALVGLCAGAFAGSRIDSDDG